MCGTQARLASTSGCKAALDADVFKVGCDAARFSKPGGSPTGWSDRPSFPSLRVRDAIYRPRALLRCGHNETRKKNPDAEQSTAAASAKHSRSEKRRDFAMPFSSDRVESTVEACAEESRALGCSITWHCRGNGAPAPIAVRRWPLTMRLAHESAPDAINVDFVPVIGRVQIFGACGARRARCDVEAGAAGAGRRFAAHILQPLVTGVVADATLLGLPESVRRLIYDLLPAPAVGLVAETAKALRAEASADATWMRLLRRDADALLVDPRDLPNAGRTRRARDIYAALVQFRKTRRGLQQFDHRSERDEHGRLRLSAPRFGVYEDDPSRFGIMSFIPMEQGVWERINDRQGLDWALRPPNYPRGSEELNNFYRARATGILLEDGVIRNAGRPGPTW